MLQEVSNNAVLNVVLQLGGTRVGCFPPNSPCIHSVSGCAPVANDITSTAACLTEGGAVLTIRGRNLDPSKIRLESKDLVDSATVTNVPYDLGARRG